MSGSDNKRIAKNAASLYVRMLFSMAVTLYTSRVVLQTLGVDDFGIFGVIAGLSGIMAIVGNSIVMAIQRQIAYEVGRPDGNVSKAISVSFAVTGIACIATLLLAETIGLWFVNSKMSFPPESMTAVNWTYQMAIVSTILSMIRFPHNALVLAYERMSFYAYSSIVEVVLKLLIVYLLIITPGSKLIVYSVLTVVVVVLITLWYWLYCRRSFPSVRIYRVSDRKAYSEFGEIAGWAMFGAVANAGYMQGVNVLINIFWGVAVNAAVSIANQVNHAVMMFVSNFQTAFNPQITKTYASGDMERHISLIEKSAKFSGCVLILIGFPVVMNMEGLLTLWLGKFPEYTVAICNSIIIAALLETISSSMMVSIFATGKIRAYQIMISIVLLLNLPIDYIFAKGGCEPWVLYVVRAVIYGGSAIVRIYFTHNLIGLSPWKFITRVMFPIFAVCLLLVLIAAPVRSLFPATVSFLSTIGQVLLCLVIAGIVILILGLKASERKIIYEFVRNKISHNNSF